MHPINVVQTQLEKASWMRVRLGRSAVPGAGVARPDVRQRVTAEAAHRCRCLIDKTFLLFFGPPTCSKSVPARIKKKRNAMAQRSTVRTTYEVERTLQPIYSGGSIALSEDGRILAACLGEEALLTDLSTGKELARAEGDGEAITSLACRYFSADLVPSG